VGAPTLRIVGPMAGNAAAYGKIDWVSAEVRAGTLTLPLEGRTSPAWTARLRDLVAGADLDHDGWDAVEVTRAHVKVRAIRSGVATDLHELLERLVTQANADFAPPPALPPPAPVDHGTRGAVAGSIALILLALGAVALQWADWEVPVRAIVVVAFVVIGPGWAVLRLWGLARGWDGLALALAVSLALAMVVAGITVYAGWWSPLGTLEALAAVTVVAALASLVRAGRDRSAASLRWRMIIDEPRG
jgi:hypothetical protein